MMLCFVKVIIDIGILIVVVYSFGKFIIEFWISEEVVVFV